jgi:hypothetical protein
LGRLEEVAKVLNNGEMNVNVHTILLSSPVEVEEPVIKKKYNNITFFHHSSDVGEVFLYIHAICYHFLLYASINLWYNTLHLLSLSL